MKRLGLSATIWLALHLTALCQTPPVLTINNNNDGTVTVSPSAVVSNYVFFTAQTATNLSRPITWTETGQATFPATNSEQFFRLTPLIPIFQFEIFYNMNLEIATATELNINGPVFSNGGLWSGANTITFDSTVWAVSKTVVNGGNDPFASYTGDGGSTYLLAGQPVSGAPPLSMHGMDANTNPAAAKAFLNLPPANYALGTYAAYYPPNGVGQVYLANQADLIISNTANGISASWPPYGTNLWVYYQDPNQPANSNPNNFCSSIAWVTNDYYLITNAGVSGSGAGHTFELWSTNYVPASRWTNSAGLRFQVWYAGYSFLSNTNFYDWREGWNNGNGISGHGKTVQVAQLDLAKFNIWLTSTAANGGGNYNNLCLRDKDHAIDSSYVYNAVPLTTTTLPAVRILNGDEMPSLYGFTLATPMPLYVWGNYNISNDFGSSISQNSVLYTRPAALMADAITILSGNWVDPYSGKRPAASQTTINAAFIAGVVQSDPNLGTPVDASNYSGGVENYFRLLESWKATSLWFNGSIVAMFPSQYATNRWRQTGNYYDAPNRFWAFNTNYLGFVNMPPLTPFVVNYVTP